MITKINKEYLMTKHMLLSLLLAPCITYTMEVENHLEIRKERNDKYVGYATQLRGTTDTIRAYYMKNENGEDVYDAYRYDEDGFSVDCCEPQKIFERLQSEYQQQSANK
jgi:hypothetical protein